MISSAPFFMELELGDNFRGQYFYPVFRAVSDGTDADAVRQKDTIRREGLPPLAIRRGAAEC